MPPRRFPPPWSVEELEINELYKEPLPPPKPCTRLENQLWRNGWFA